MLCAEDLLALANYVLNMYFCSKRSRWLCSHGMLAEGSHVGAMRWQLCMHHALPIPRHKINETRSPALPRNLLPGRLVHNHTPDNTNNNIHIGAPICHRNRYRLALLWSISREIVDQYVLLEPICIEYNRFNNMHVRFKVWEWKY